MIDPAAEQLVSLADACRLLPRRRLGKKPHLSCLYRWTTRGCRGVVLESIQVGGTRCTSREAITRFITRLTMTRVPNPEEIRTIHRVQDAKIDNELATEGL